MKQLAGVVLFFFGLISIHSQTIYSDHIFNENIKTITLSPKDDAMGNPMIFLYDRNSLIFSFDELNNDYHNFAYTIIHCDANWQLSELSPNEYLDGYTEAFIADYQFSKNTKVPYIHYSLQIPNKEIQITRSGNYILKIYPENKPDNPILTKKFYVVDPQCQIGGSVVACSNPEIIYQAQEIKFKVNIDREYTK